MSKIYEQRRRVCMGEFEYLVDDDDQTAWIDVGNSGGAREYTMPDKVLIDGIFYNITSAEAGAYGTPLDVNLEEVYFPDSYEYFDEHTFYGSPIKRIHLGKGFRYYMYWTLKSAADDLQVDIDPGNPYIKMSNDGLFVLSKDGKDLIYMVQDVENAIVPEGVESILGCAISCKQRLQHVHLPSSLKSITIDGMIQNQALESIVIPEGVNMIGHQAFCGDTALKMADLPSTITEIDSDTFMDDLQLARIILRAPEVVKVNYIDYDDFPLNTCHLTVPKHLIPHYRKHPLWGWFKHIDSIEETENV